MPSTPLPGEKKPKWNQVLTPEFFEAVGYVENGSQNILAYNNKGNNGNPPDFGLMQFNQSNVKKMFKQQFGFEIQDGRRDVSGDTFGQHPESDVLLDPYVNARLSFGLLEELYTNLYNSKNTPGFRAMPIHEQQEALLAAYKSGQSGFEKRWNAEGKYWRTDPDHVLRTNKLKEYQMLPSQQRQQFSNKLMGFLDPHEARKHAIVRGVADPTQAESMLMSHGFKKSPTPQQPVPQQPSIIKPFSDKHISQVGKQLSQDLTPPPVDTTETRSLMEELQILANNFEESALKFPEKAIQTLGEVGQALDLPGKIIRGIGINGIPEGGATAESFVTPLLQNAVESSGTEFNRVMSGLPTPEEIQMKSDARIATEKAAGRTPDPAVLEHEMKMKAYSETMGLVTEIGTSIPPLIPLSKFGVVGGQGTKGTKVVPPGTRNTGRPSEIVTRELSIYKGVEDSVEKPTDLITRTSGDLRVDPAEFDNSMSADILGEGAGGGFPPNSGGPPIDVPHGDLGRSLPKQAPIRNVSMPGRDPRKFSALTRFQDAALDALSKVSSTGEMAAITIRNALDRSEQSTGIIFSRVKQHFGEIFGKRIISSRNPIKSASTTKFFDLNQKESDALVEMLYRGDINPTHRVKVPQGSTDKLSKVVPEGQKLLEDNAEFAGPPTRITPGLPSTSRRGIEEIPTGPSGEKGEVIDFTKPPWNLKPERVEKIKQMARKYYEEGTYPVSSHAGVQRLEVLQPNGKKTPVGDPNMFFPQVPVSVKLKDLLHGRRFETLYNVAKKSDPDLSRIEYKERLNSLFGAMGRVKGRDNSVHHFPGLENSRLFNAAEIADEQGTSVAQVLREYGYEDDPLRALISFASGGLRRGETELISDPLVQMAGRLEEEMIKAGSKHRYFPEKVINHFRNVNQVEQLDQFSKGWVSWFLNMNNVGLLQMAGVSNFAQLSFVFSRGSLGDVFKGTVQSLKNIGKDNIVAERSGALFIEMMQEWTKPATAAGRFAQQAFGATGFTGVNRNIRSFAANVGMYHVMRLASKIKKAPKDAGIRAQLSELGLNPDAVLKDMTQLGGISQRNLARGTQTFANMVANREGLTGVPAWATAQGDLAKIVLQYKKFALANHAEFVRQISNAPNKTEAAKRIAKLFIGAEVTGEVINDIRTLMGRFQNPFDPHDINRDGDKDSPFSTMGELSKRLADNFITSYGTILALYISSVYNGKEGVLSSMAGPTFVSIAEIHDDPTKAVVRRLPIIGPQASAILREMRGDKNESSGFGGLGGLGGFGSLGQSGFKR